MSDGRFKLGLRGPGVRRSAATRTTQQRLAGQRDSVTPSTDDQLAALEPEFAGRRQPGQPGNIFVTPPARFSRRSL